MVAAAVEHIGALAAPLVQDQVDGHALGVDVNIVRLQRAPGQGFGNFPAGGVRRVNDTSLAVTALFGEVERAFSIGVAVELDALGDQPLHGPAAVFHGESHRIRVAQAGTGFQGVGDVGLDAVVLVQHRRDTALGVEGGALVQFSLAQNGDLQVGGQLQGHAQPGGATADNEYVVLEMLTHNTPPVPPPPTIRD